MSLFAISLWVVFGVGALAQLILEYVLTYVATDKRTNAHKNVRRSLLGLNIAFFTITLFKTIYDSRSADAEVEEWKNKYSQLTNQVSLVTSNQAKLSADLNSLRFTLATNQVIDPALRLAMFDAYKSSEMLNSQLTSIEDLVQRWETKSAHAMTANEAARRKTWIDNKGQIQKCWEIFDYCIRRSEVVLRDVGRNLTNRVYSTYKGLPEDVISTTRVAELSVENHPQWNFAAEVYVFATISPGNMPRIRVGPSGDGQRIGNLRMELRPQPSQDSILITLRTGDAPLLSENVSMSDSNQYRQKIDGYLLDLVGAHAKAVNRR